MGARSFSKTEDGKSRSWMGKRCGAIEHGAGSPSLLAGSCGKREKIEAGKGGYR